MFLAKVICKNWYPASTSHCCCSWLC